MKYGNLQLDIRPGDTLFIAEIEILCLPKVGHPRTLRLHIKAPLNQQIELVRAKKRIEAQNRGKKF